MAAGDLGSLRIRLTADGTALSKGLKTSTSQVKAFGSTMQEEITNNAAGWQSLGMAITGVGVALSALAVISISTFASFEQNMRNVQSVAGATDDEFVEMTEHAKTLGETTVFTARQAGDAMYLLASAGFTAKEQMASTGDIMELAAATQSDLAQATALTVSTLKAFGLPAEEAGRATNVFAATIASSQANMEKLSTAMPYVATTFDQLGFSVEDAAGALGILFDRGLQASTAGTRLRGAMNALLDPTDKAAAAIESLGINIKDVSPATNSLVDIVREFEAAGLDATTATQIFGERAEGMTILVNAGADALESYTAEITGTEKAAELAAIQLDTLSGDVKLLKSAMEGAAISLGEALAPGIRAATTLLTELIGKFNALPQPVKAFTAVTGAATAGLSLFVGGGALLLAQLPQIIAGVKLMGTVFGALSLGPVGIAIGGVAIAVSAIASALLLYKDAKKDVFTQQEMATIANNVKGIEAAIQDYTSQIEGLEKHMISLKDQGVDPLTSTIVRFGESVLITEEIERLNKKVADLGGEMRVTKGDIFGWTESMEKAGQKATDATEAFSLFGTVADTIATGMAELGKFLRANLTDWDVVIEKFQEWQDITGAGYRANTLQAIDYWENVRDQGDLGVDAQKAVANTLIDLQADWFDSSKLGFAEVTIKEGEELEKRAVLDTEFLGAVQATAGRRADAQKEAADERLATEVDVNAQLNTINDNFNAGVIREQESNLSQIQANTEAFQMETEAELDNHNAKIVASVGEKNAAIIVADADLYDAMQLSLLRFHAFELDQYDAKVALLLREYKEIRADFEKHGGDLIALERWKNEQLRELQAEHWTQFANTVSAGLDNVSESYRGIYNLFNEGEIAQSDFQEKWIVKMATWVGDQVELLNNLTTVWKDAMSIISTVAGWIGGGDGGGGVGAAVSLAGAAGNATGNVGALAQAGSGLTAALGAVGGAAKAAGSGIASAASAAAAAGPAIATAAAVATTAWLAFEAVIKPIGAAFFGWGVGETPFFGEADPEFGAKTREREAEDRERRANEFNTTMDQAFQNFVTGGGTFQGLASDLIPDTFTTQWRDANELVNTLGDSFSSVSDILAFLTQYFGSAEEAMAFMSSSVFNLSDELAGHSLTTALDEVRMGFDELMDPLDLANLKFEAQVLGIKSAQEELAKYNEKLRILGLLESGVSKANVAKMLQIEERAKAEAAKPDVVRFGKQYKLSLITEEQIEEEIKAAEALRAKEKKLYEGRLEFYALQTTDQQAAKNLFIYQIEQQKLAYAGMGVDSQDLRIWHRNEIRKREDSILQAEIDAENARILQIEKEAEAAERAAIKAMADMEKIRKATAAIIEAELEQKAEEQARVSAWKMANTASKEAAKEARIAQIEAIAAKRESDAQLLEEQKSAELARLAEIETANASAAAAQIDAIDREHKEAADLHEKRLKFFSQELNDQEATEELFMLQLAQQRSTYEEMGIAAKALQRWYKSEIEAFFGTSTNTPSTIANTTVGGAPPGITNYSVALENQTDILNGTLRDILSELRNPSGGSYGAIDDLTRQVFQSGRNQGLI